MTVNVRPPNSVPFNAVIAACARSADDYREVYDTKVRGAAFIPSDRNCTPMLPAVQDDDVGAIGHDDETRTSRAVLISTLAAWSSR